MKIHPLNLQLVYTDGKPTRAIVDVEALQGLLEAAEQLDDLDYLNSLKGQPREFVSLEEYLQLRSRETSNRKQAGADERSLKSKSVPNRHREAS